MRPRRFFISAAICGLIAASGAHAADADRGVLARSKDKLTAAISSNTDTDAFTMELGAGGQIKLKLAAAKGTALLPDVKLFDPAGADRTGLATFKGVGGPKPQIKKFVVPDGSTGVWTAVIDGGATTGGYTASFVIKDPKGAKVKGLSVGAGGTDFVDIMARDGALLTVTIKNKGGPNVDTVRILRPDGTEMHGDAAFAEKGKKISAKKLGADGGFGVYRIELNNPAAEASIVDVVVKVKLPKFKKRKATIGVETTLTNVAEASVMQEDVGATLSATGANILAGTWAEVSGDGVTVTGVTVNSATSATVTVSVDSDAAIGKRDLTLLPPPLLGEPATLDDAFDLFAPVPTVTAIDPSIVTQGDVATPLTIAGTGFRAGGTISFPGSGIAAGATTVVSSTEATATMTLDLDAAPGSRDVSFTQSAPNGGASGTGTNLLNVHYPTPSVTAATPAVKQAGGNTTVTITGANLREGGSVLVSGTGLTVGNPTFVNDTTATVNISAANDATLGTRDVTWSQRVDRGARSGKGTGVLSVHAPDPVITGVSPASIEEGVSGTLVTITGTGFRTGATLSISGAGLTLTNPTFVNETTFRVTVDVAASTTLGGRDVTITQSALAGGASDTSTDGLRIDAPTPTVTAVSPTSLEQDDVSETITVTGTNFRSGGTISVSGSGLTLGTTSISSSTSASVPVTVATGATLGDRDISFTQSASAGGASGTGQDLLTILHPDPTITSVAPDRARRSESGTFTLTGTGFRSGGTVTTDATDVTLSNPKFVSTTTFEIDFDTASDATLGDFDLTYTQPAGGGGAAVTLTDGYEVQDALVIDEISPTGLPPAAARVTTLIAGDGFNSGTTAAFSGSGITIDSQTRDSDQQLTLVLSVASNAAIGGRDVTITPGAGGGSAVVFDDAFFVVPGDPTVTDFSHATLAKGASTVPVTIEGTNFRSGAVLSASGSGVTFASVVVVDAQTITANATVTSGAATGVRTVSVAHKTSEGSGSGALADAFEVIAAGPTVTSVNPSAIAATGSGGPTRVVPVTITGTNFMTGASVTIAKSGGSGATVVANTAEVVSDTMLTVDLQLTGTSTTGLWNVTVTNPSTLGNSGTTGNNKLDVKSASTLTVNRVFSRCAHPHGGERVTIHGGGFAAGDVVDFGTERGYSCQVIDQNTLVVTVPPPVSTSRTARTTVDVKVTPSTGSAATLTSGYTYDIDDIQMVVETTFPAQATTGISSTLDAACVLLTAPMKQSTAVYGTASTDINWFESGGFFTANGARRFGPNDRWLVIGRSSGTTLAINNAGKYILNIPSKIESIAGTAFFPTRISSTTRDQHDFTVTGSSTDTSAPTVTRTPADTATGISTTVSVKLVFNEEIDPSTLTTTDLKLAEDVSTTNVPVYIELEDDLKTVWLHPETELKHSLKYKVTVGAGITDLHGNTFSNASTTFTTGGTTDNTNPTVDSVIIEDLSAALDGSTTFIAGNDSNTSGQALTAGSATAFDVLLPRDGFELFVEFSDEGGAGIDPSTFSCKCSVAVGSSSANAELASKFTVTSTYAVWRLGSSDSVATGDNVTFTFTVKDTSNNAASNKVITVDVLSLATSSLAGKGGDLDPFGTRQSWILRTDLDSYTHTISSQVTPAMRGATTTATSNNKPDYEEALEMIGLNSSSMTAAAAATVNGKSLGTNAIMRRLVIERMREILRARYGIDEDGTRGDDAVNIEFLLAGEQGSLSSLPTFGTVESSNAGGSHSEMSISGSDHVETGAFTQGGTNGRAFIDARNTRQEHDLNDGVAAGPTGLLFTTMMKRNLNSAGFANPFFEAVSVNFVGVHGGTPVGEDVSDDDVLAGTFDRSTSANATHNTRYDDIYDAIEIIALYVSRVVAHEIGHSLGMMPNSGPKTGLFGWAHRDNTFTEATSTSLNTSNHMRGIAPENTMSPSSNVRADVRTGSEFKRFNPMVIAHLLQRLLYDEGR